MTTKYKKSPSPRRSPRAGGTNPRRPKGSPKRATSESLRRRKQQSRGGAGSRTRWPGTGSRSTQGSARPTRVDAASVRYVGPRGYARCTIDESSTRKTYALEGVTREEKLTAEQMAGLIGYIRETIGKGHSVRSVCSYAFMSKLSRVLCRWPRPSEIRRIAKVLTGETVTCWLGELQLSGTAETRWGDVVGKEGANFVAMTKKDGLMYMWLQGDNKWDKVLKIYALDKPSVEKALLKLTRWLQEFRDVKPGQATIKESGLKDQTTRSHFELNTPAGGATSRSRRK